MQDSVFLHSHISSCSYLFWHILTPSSGTLTPTVLFVVGVHISEKVADTPKCWGAGTNM